MKAHSVVHLVSAVAMTTSMLVVALSKTPKHATWAARVGALLGIIIGVTGFWGQRAFESTHRRAVFFESFSAGLWLERMSHWSLTACAFAIACACAPEDSSEKIQDTLPFGSGRKMSAIASVFFSVAVFVADAIVHARLPSAAVP